MRSPSEILARGGSVDNVDDVASRRDVRTWIALASAHGSVTATRCLNHVTSTLVDGDDAPCAENARHAQSRKKSSVCDKSAPEVSIVIGMNVSPRGLPLLCRSLSRAASDAAWW